MPRPGGRSYRREEKRRMEDRGLELPYTEEKRGMEGWKKCKNRGSESPPTEEPND